MARIPKVILLVETSCGYGRKLLRGIAKYCHTHGPWRFYLNPPHYSRTNQKKQQWLKMKDWGADGIIVREPKKNDKIFELGLPTIVSPNVIEKLPHLPTLCTDRVAAGRLAAEHFLNRGFHHFGFSGFDDMPWSQVRGKSFAERLTESGFETHIYNGTLSEIEHPWEEEQMRLADWIKSLPKPVGLMTCNDDRGRQVAETCKIAGVHVPDEVAIIGVDNDEVICNLADPPLSSIALNSERMGYEVARLLDKLMAGEKMAGQRIIDRPTHVVRRQSTDILAIEDHEIAAAVGFIHQNARRIIQVNDVVDATTLSRRSLEQRFRETLGHPILHEIRRVRVSHACQMLMETDMAVSQIALSLGYPGGENVARYFRREMGMSPQIYRKKYGRK